MIDQIIVGVYLLISLAVGLYAGRNTRTLEDFAVGNRNLSTIVLVSTVFASVVDAGMTTGLASSTYSVGPIFLWSFLGIIFSNLTISFFIAPRMKPFLGLLSSGDIFEKLYGKRAKTLMGCSTIIESTLTAAIQIFAIAQFSQYFFGLPASLSSIVVTMLIVVYTFRGGIRSITATEVFQFGIMIIAIPIMCGIALNDVGGFSAIATLLKDDMFYFPTTQNRNNLEYAAVFASFALPCLYPLCIQRMLMAKSPQQISSTFLINGFLSLPFYLTIGLIGIIAYITLPETDPNFVFTALANKILPTGIKGFVLAGMVAVFMSTVDSILNIGSLAIIHDVTGSLIKGGLKPKTELRLMKLASVSIAVAALIICHLFGSVMEIVFFLMAIGNSIFFPGFFWGIIGVKASKSGFWSGVAVGAAVMLSCTLAFNLFPLYAMLIAIVCNSVVILIDYYIDKPIKALSATSFLQPENKRAIIKNLRRHAFFRDSIRNQDYCSVFFVCAIAVSLFPFFFPAIHGLMSFDSPILTASIATACISLFMLFREIWWHKVDKLFPVLWISSLTLALPAQSYYMLGKSGFSLVWLADCIVIVPLMFLLTPIYPLLASVVLGFIAALTMYFSSESIMTQETALSFGYWALVVHITVLAICLALFRMRDQEKFSITSTTLAHETSRSFLSFENAACYLNKYLPEIIDSYRNNALKNPIEERALMELLALPNQLEEAARRSRNIVEKLSFGISNNAHFDTFNIAICLQKALSDPALKDKLMGRISVDDTVSLIIKGDMDQITQVFINLLENALHAIRSKPEAKIHVAIYPDSIIVRDSGDGIQKGDLPNIFDDKFSTKSSKGQGLSLCKTVIKNHGGTICCKSIEGEFTEFRINFPVVKNGYVYA